MLTATQSCRGMLEPGKRRFIGVKCAGKLRKNEENDIQLFQEKEIQTEYNQLLMSLAIILWPEDNCGRSDKENEAGNIAQESPLR